MRPPSVEGGLLSELGLVLGVLGGMLVVVALVTAQRPAGPLPDRAAFRSRWQALHGGHDPGASVWVRSWLTVSHRAALPLARLGVNPHVLTAASVWLAVMAVLPAAAGGAWPVVAAWLIVASGLVDGLDGAVAALTGRATRLGYVLDSVADRVSEALFLAVVVAAGGAAALAMACGALLLFHDYLRARAANAGAGEVGVVTVAERPHRVVVLAVTAHAAGVVAPAAVSVTAAGLWVMLLLAAVGVGQLGLAVWRGLAATDADAAAEAEDGPA